MISKSINRIVVSVLIVFLISFKIFAGDSTDTNENDAVSFTYGFENDFVTRYIWHGLNYNHGIIHQPTIWATHNDFTFYSWASFTQHDVDENTICNEIDLAVQYSKQLNSIYLESSLTYIYALIDDAPATTEAYLKISYELFETEIYSDVTLDVMEYSGSLSGNVGINKTLFENDELSFSSGISLGWANNKFNTNYVGVIENVKPFNYSLLFVEANYYCTDFLYIKPHIEYCYLFSPAFKSVSGNSLTNFGIAVGVEF
jgi:hypothetical protein